MQTLAGLALSLIVVVFAANLVAVHYTRGALRAAAMAGARAGALVGGSEASCEHRAGNVLFGESGLLRGPYGSEARVRCRHLGATVAAEGTVTLDWWIDMLPPVAVRVTVEAAAELEPHRALPPSNGSWP